MVSMSHFNIHLSNASFAWYNEFYQRNSIIHILNSNLILLNDQDIILHSDMDEIYNIVALQNIKILFSYPSQITKNYINVIILL